MRPARAIDRHPPRGEKAAERKRTAAWTSLTAGARQKPAFSSVDYAELSDVQLRGAAKYFDETVFPGSDAAGLRPRPSFPAHLQPQPEPGGADPRSPKATNISPASRFPIRCRSWFPLNRAAKAKPKRPRASDLDLVWLEQVIAANLAALFPGMEVLEAHPFHVTRDADIAIKELEAEDLLETIEEGVRQRRFGRRGAPDGDSGYAAAHPGILMNNLEVDAQRGLSHRRPAVPEAG